MTSNTSLIIPENDLSFMLQQTDNETNTMIAGMLSLINKNEDLNNGLQNQPWCKRMFNTIIGKNKATALEIRQNHDKLNTYIVQAVGELYNRNKINNQIMISLGLQITQIYNSHLELKNVLHILASKLNEKIESVDNYHTLLQEIDVGVYGNESSISELLTIISQIDYRTITDTKKMRILERKLANKDLLNPNNSFSIKEFVTEISNINEDILGIVYTDLQLYHSDYIIIELAIKIIESWNLLSSSNKKMLKKQVILDNVISEIGIDDEVEIRYDEFYDEIISIRQALFDESQCVISEEPADNDYITNEDEDYSDEFDDFQSSVDELNYELSQTLNQLNSIPDNIEASYNNDNIADKISSYVEYYLGSESNCITHTGYISFDLRKKAKKNIVDKSDVVSGVAGAVIGGFFGIAGAAIGYALGNNAKNSQEFTCTEDDIIAIVDASIFENCKDGMVFTEDGVFFSQTGDVSIFVEYSDISSVSGTSGVMGGKLKIERYYGSDFSWTETIISKNIVADLLNEIISLF